jgi:signal transduction histidine kinase
MQATTVTVISEDAALIVMCREALRDLGQAGAWRLITAPERPPSTSGICLWDYDPSKHFTPNPPTTSDAINLFLVSPKDLDQFYQVVPRAEGSILLKPVTRAVLQAFLGSVVPIPSDKSLLAERDELLRSLLEANLKLQEYDRRRTNFLARAVHELRVPLTALAGFSGLLAAGELGELNPNQLDALRRMELSIARMTRMTTAMFELSIAGQGVGSNAEQTDQHVESARQVQEGQIVECVDRAIQLMRSLAEEKDVNIVIRRLVPPDSPLFFESDQIEQVLVNLLDNACKASPRRSSIEISGYPYFWERRFLAGRFELNDRRRSHFPVPNSFRIDIRDAGPGVQPEHLESIFEEYTSYFGSHDRSGGGLGLAICRLIMERHHGRVWAASESSGALFSFVLPYDVAKRAQRPSPLSWRKSQSA